MIPGDAAEVTEPGMSSAEDILGSEVEVEGLPINSSPSRALQLAVTSPLAIPESSAIVFGLR